jgi:hypothetical protein
MSSCSGSSLYVGIPGSGKTEFALRRLWADCARTRRVGIILDLARVEQFKRPGVARASSLAELERIAWAKGEHVVYTPEDEDLEVQRVAFLAREVHGNANLLVDECAGHLGRKTQLVKLLRQHRHARSCVHLTTQHFSGDVGQAALSTAPELFVFRTTAPAALEALEADFRLPRETVSRLEKFRYLHCVLGFG